MLYLEDYLELTENLPQEISDKMSSIQELDVQVENANDKVEEDIKSFFSNIKKMKPSERQVTHENILKQYSRMHEDGQEKLGIASEMRESIVRYVKKLDQELEKFKYELEADSPGITESLEKRSLEMDEPLRDSQKENRYTSSRGPSSVLSNSDWRNSTVGLKKEESDFTLSTNLSLSPQTSSVSYGLSAMSSGNNVIAAAASQAIAATQQNRQGRKAATFQTSYDSGSHGVFTSEFPLGSELAHAAKAAIAASSLPHESNNINVSSTVTGGHVNKRQKKTHRTSGISSNMNNAVRDRSPSPMEEIHSDTVVDQVVDGAEWSFDPNEPRYCICNHVSYGDMVACDNAKCPLEWFHYPCVGITATPKGKWFCPPCTQAMNAKRQRK